LNKFWIRAIFAKKHRVTNWVQNVYYCFNLGKMSIITLCGLFFVTMIAKICKLIFLQFRCTCNEYHGQSKRYNWHTANVSI